jgi:2-polyprenyl-3-methyl-5-hydroxy-6-metoxy-1,4-benzoquinol methylase
MQFKEKKIQHGVIQCDPLPEEQFLKSYYKEKYYQEGKGSYDVTYTEEEKEHKIYEADLIIHSLVETIEKKDRSNYKFLELGCGEGFLLSQASKAGFNVLGVDHSSFGIQKWYPELKNNFIECDLYEFLDDEKNHAVFDFCVLKNVLEHVTAPEKLLKRMQSVLRPNGKLVITVPNGYSRLQKKILELGLASSDEWFYPPDHLYYFNTDNFSLYVKDFGFKVVDMYSSFPVDLFLLNQHSNYYKDRLKGKEAHYSRIRMDLLIKQAGFDKALNTYRSMAQCGIGRNFTAILEN